MKTVIATFLVTILCNNAQAGWVTEFRDAIQKKDKATIVKLLASQTSTSAATNTNTNTNTDSEPAQKSDSNKKLSAPSETSSTSRLSPRRLMKRKSSADSDNELSGPVTKNVNFAGTTVFSATDHLLHRGDFGTFIHLAVEAGDLEILTLIFAAMPSCQAVKFLNHVDSEGRTPLHLAVRDRNLKLVLWLLLNGAQANPTQSSIISPFQLAMAIGAQNIAYFLVRFGAQVEECEGVHPHLEALSSVAANFKLQSNWDQLFASSTDGSVDPEQVLNRMPTNPQTSVTNGQHLSVSDILNNLQDFDSSDSETEEAQSDALANGQHLSVSEPLSMLKDFEFIDNETKEVQSADLVFEEGELESYLINLHENFDQNSENKKSNEKKKKKRKNAKLQVKLSLSTSSEGS